KVTANLEEDFIRVASSKFLDYLVERCCAVRRGQTTDTISGYCMMELFTRGSKLSFVTYEKALELYGSPDFTFHLLGRGHVRLGSLNPGSANQTNRSSTKM